MTLEDVQDDDNDADEPYPQVQLSQAGQQDIIMKLIHCGEFL